MTQLLRDPSLRKDPVLAKDGPYTETLRDGDYSILFMDDPDHQRLRGLVTQAFSKRATEAFRPRIHALADELLQAIDQTGGPVDIMSAFAVPLPIHVIAEVLGIDPARHADFKRWSDDVALSFQNLSNDETNRVAGSNLELRDYMAPLSKTAVLHHAMTL